MNKKILIEDIVSKPTPLSGDQKKAVISNYKYVRVVAGAGAGKTETLTRRIVYLLLVEGLEPSDIVAFTFTDKAAENMKNRIYLRVKEHGREDIAKRLGEMYVGTIHGFCLRTLEEKFAGEGFGNYKVFDADQEMAFLMRTGWGLGLGKNKGNYSKNCSDFLTNVNAVYSEYLDMKTVKKEAHDFYGMLKEYQESLDKHRVLTFGRIIYECVKRVESHPESVDYIKHLIVDEFQDIDTAQFRLIKTIGQKASVFVVGDPRQTIYKWRGSNEIFFKTFGGEFNPVDYIKIKENRRSGKNIVKISNIFADTFEKMNYPHMVATRSESGDVRLVALDNSKKEADWVASQIEKLVSNGFNYSDIAILLRSVKTSAKPFIEEFKKRKIPYTVGGKVGLFKRDDAQAVGRLLAWLDDKGFWVEDPYHWSASQITGDGLLHSAIALWKSAVDFPVHSDIEDKLLDWKKKVLKRDYKTFKQVFYSLLVLLDYKKLDLSKPLHAAIAANIGRVSTMIQDFEVARRIVEKTAPNCKKDLHALTWFMNSYAINSYEEHTGDDVAKSDTVQIMTVHQAKGLEWPVVFVSSLVTRRFPSSGSSYRTHWYLPDSIFDRARYEGGLEDERRLFYVAMTRARDALVLTRFTHDTTSRNRGESQFLSEIAMKIVLNEEGSEANLKYAPLINVNIDEMQTYSTTELINYMLCPHHYRLNKLWGYMQEISPLIGYGEAMHFCMRRAAELIKEGYSPTSAVTEAVDKNFYLPFAHEEKLESVKKKAKQVLREFAKTREQDMMNIEEVEMRVEFPLENATLVGKVDVILKDREKGIVEIRDYKTSDKVISPEDSRFQLYLYTHGLENIGWNIDSGSIAYLDEARVEPVNVGKVDVKNAKAKAEYVIGKIRKGEFHPRPRDKEFCKQCEYRDICKGAL